ncbi:MAG: acetylornithine carbamoyltransferase [Bacteroides sp.]|nr:MAG: acetylornithine carbamoyltransferase [Bacteroides sp.]
MKNFISVNDVSNIHHLLSLAKFIKNNPKFYHKLGKNKIIGLIFFNNSLRTRLSIQKAAYSLGMDIIIINVNTDNWSLEFNDNKIMNGNTVEHIKDATIVLNNYCDIIAIRSFASLKNREYDYNETIFNKILCNIKIPVVSLESAVLHPLQSFADLITIEENKNIYKKNKIVLAWAPHIKALPQAVPNSFAEWICNYMNIFDYEFTICSPKNFELNSKYTFGAHISNDLEQSIKDADFIYVKNWSSYNDYGSIYNDIKFDWYLDKNKIKKANNAKIMHCLPVRRELEISSELLDGEMSLIEEQVVNRVIATQSVLVSILNNFI